MNIIKYVMLVLSYLGIFIAVAYQILLNLAIFGAVYSGYIIIDWSLLGLLGVIFIPLIHKKPKSKNEEKSGKLSDDN